MIVRSPVPYILILAISGLLAFMPFFASGFQMAFAIGCLNYAVLATAWGLFSGPTRYVSLASVVFFGIGSYTVAVLGEVLPWPVILLISALIGGGVALIVGLATLRLAGIYFVIFTFGLSEMVRQLVTWYEVNVTRSIGRYIFLDITQPQIFWQLLGLLAVVLIGAVALQRSRLGFALRVIGGDETMARHFGLNPTFAKLGLFTASSAIMALAGAIMAPRWTYIDPAIAFNATLSFQVVIMALLGGMHRIYGPLLGAVLMSFLFEALGSQFPQAFSLLLGLVFIVIVYLLPNGIIGRIEELFALKRAVPQSTREGERT
ncbi:branched-chain amino acid transport system permease protein [Lutimaribacter pacificus]|uniref:Amino acid/amide ABC transporter membrane protein 2, HAAT family n=1 Tax=Lutimaribacter pacificus TaxID=391948 RepID=A0A1H0L7E0_9RHOB|nr:branched-chain amino acid ABC transporter permease [Lutimaribacter pacificus]SDO64025.1 branched-chain amino acid transport system permease protein [Lutimaribacter pacificus]SHK70316.1 amino acid/amide ABC transporter membrane protein 2, HAAT family [Lutimaribacter pacificus]